MRNDSELKSEYTSTAVEDSCCESSKHNLKNRRKTKNSHIKMILTNKRANQKRCRECG